MATYPGDLGTSLCFSIDSYQRMNRHDIITSTHIITPLRCKHRVALPTQRLWNYLVRQEVVQDIFITYIFKKKRGMEDAVRKTNTWRLTVVEYFILLLARCSGTAPCPVPTLCQRSNPSSSSAHYHTCFCSSSLEWVPGGVELIIVFTIRGGIIL